MTELARGTREQRAPGRRVLDLSVVQVVASALAAVVGAVLTSLLGVHGTIIGAAVVSTSATTGAAVFQHAFRRTGDGIRSRVPAVGAPRVARAPGAPRSPREERAGQRADARAAFAEGESVTVYRGGATRRPRGWKAYALTTGLVFGLAMVTVTAAELIAGKPVAAVVRNEPGRGTSLGGGSTGSPAPSGTRAPTPATSSAAARRTSGSASPGAGAEPENGTSPSPAHSSASAATASPSPTLSGSAAGSGSEATGG